MLNSNPKKTLQISVSYAYILGISQGQTGLVRVLLGSQISRIDENWVSLDHAGEPLMLENDFVIVCAGGVLPTPMLKEIGIRVETKFGTE
jgi:hypothetical protein